MITGGGGNVISVSICTTRSSSSSDSCSSTSVLSVQGGDDGGILGSSTGALNSRGGANGGAGLNGNFWGAGGCVKPKGEGGGDGSRPRVSGSLAIIWRAWCFLPLCPMNAYKKYLDGIQAIGGQRDLDCLV